MSVKNEMIDFSDMSGGKNSAFPKHAIAKNQVTETLNAIHEVVGISRAPGYSGITPYVNTDVLCAMIIYLYPSPWISEEVSNNCLAALETLFAANDGETITFAQWAAAITSFIPTSTYIAVIQMIGDTVTYFGSPVDPAFTPTIGECEFAFAAGTRGRFDLTKHIIHLGDDLGVSVVQKYS